jgi:hypothetical protein
MAPVASDSATVIAWLESQGGWGFGRMQIDLSIEVLRAEQTTPFRTHPILLDGFELGSLWRWQTP